MSEVKRWCFHLFLETGERLDDYVVFGPDDEELMIRLMTSFVNRPEAMAATDGVPIRIAYAHIKPEPDPLDIKTIDLMWATGFQLLGHFTGALRYIYEQNRGDDS